MKTKSIVFIISCGIFFLPVFVYASAGFMGADFARGIETLQYLSFLSNAKINFIGSEKVFWTDIEPTATSGYDWTGYDAQVKSVEASGGDILPTIGSASAWATAVDAGTLIEANMPSSPPKSQYQTNYYNFLKSFVERYDKDGVNDMPGLLYAHNYLQIEDEAQNLGDSWFPSSACAGLTSDAYYSCAADEYGAMLKLAYQAAKTANSNARIVSFSFNPGDYFDNNPANPSFSSPRIAYLKSVFLDRALTSYSAYYDIIGIQCNYDYTGIPAWVKYMKDKYSVSLGKSIQCADAGSLPLLGKHFYQSEKYFTQYPFMHDADIIKILSDGITNSRYTEIKSWWESEKAKLSVKKAVVAAGSGVDNIFFQFIMPPGGWNNIWGYSGLLGYGVSKENDGPMGTPRAITHALGQLNNKAADLRTIENLKILSAGADPYAHTWLYRMHDLQNKISYIAWKDSGANNTIDLSGYLSGTVKVAPIITQNDTNNNPIIPTTATAFSNAIPISSIPVFIEAGIQDAVSPIISSISTSNITPSTVSITWTTNEPADGQLEFGTSACPCVNTTPIVPDMLTAHVINLSNLTPSTTYYYRIKSKDALGNLSVSSSYSFKTAASSTEIITFGVAYPNAYTAGDYSAQMSDLGINRSSQTILWGDIEPTDNNFVYTRIDNFVAQLTSNTSAIIRLSGRNANAIWATASPDYNVPNDLSMGGAYYNYIYSVVNHVNGLGNGAKVTAYEMEWEADCVKKHWAGTATQYAEMAHTFYKAVKAANSNASVILGSANGDLDSCNSFTTGVLSHLSTNYPTEAFDKFDMHLYHHRRASAGQDQWDTTDDRVAYYRNLLDAYPAFIGKPMVVTEYGSPSPSEFDYMDTTAYTNLINAIYSDLCVMATNLSGYPDHLRMFSFNLTGGDAALDQKHDRITGKINVYKSLMAAAEGISEMYFWNMNMDWSQNCSGVYMGHPVYGKMGLHYAINNGSLVKRDSYNYFKKFISEVGNSITSASKIDIVGYPNIYLYDVIKTDSNKIKVMWENRNLFDGEDSAATSVSVSVSPWTSVSVEDLFGNTQTPNVINGHIIINVKDTPIFISEIVDTTPPTISSISVSNITPFTATITWVTSEPTDGQSEFGTSACPCANKTPIVPDLTTFHTINLSGLTPNTTYYYHVSAKDASGNLSVSQNYTFETNKIQDEIPPNPPTDVIIKSGDSQLVISWSNAKDPDFAGVKILRSETDYPASPVDGFIVYEGAQTTITDTKLQNGKMYYYKIYSYDDIRNYSIPAKIKAAPKAEIIKIEPPATTTPSIILIKEGSLIRGPDGIKVYIVNSFGFKRHIFNPAIFNMYGHFKWNEIKDIDQKTMDSYATSDFYRADNDPRVFSLKEIDEAQGKAEKRWLDIKGEKFTQFGYKWEQVFIINEKERDYYQEGTAITEQELQEKIIH